MLAESFATPLGLDLKFRLRKTVMESGVCVGWGDPILQNGGRNLAAWMEVSIIHLYPTGERSTWLLGKARGWREETPREGNQQRAPPSPPHR